MRTGRKIPSAALVGTLAILSVLCSLTHQDCLAANSGLLGWFAGDYAVTAFGVGVRTSGDSHSAVVEAVGPPDGEYVSLGREIGYVVVTMMSPFTNGPGADILVYEIGSQQGGIDERFSVFISSDATSWTQVAAAIKNDSGSKSASIDIFPYPGEYRYVKIVDQGRSGGSTPGADIDAIEALHPTSSPSNRMLILLVLLVALGVMLAVIR